MNNPLAILGNNYKSLTITIPSTTTYSVMEENKDKFPDWNNNWDKRDYWNICILKDLSFEVGTTNYTEPIFYIKFHDEDFDWVPVKEENLPFIIEPFVFKDIFLKNDLSEAVTINVSIFNDAAITPPPFKPEEVTLITSAVNNVQISFIDPTIKNTSYDANIFKIERSSTNANTGYTQIDIIEKTSSLAIQSKIEPIIYTDSSVTSGTYWYRIRSYSSKGGNSAYTDALEVTV